MSLNLEHIIASLDKAVLKDKELLKKMIISEVEAEINKNLNKWITLSIISVMLNALAVFYAAFQSSNISLGDFLAVMMISNGLYFAFRHGLRLNRSLVAEFIHSDKTELAIIFLNLLCAGFGTAYHVSEIERLNGNAYQMLYPLMIILFIFISYMMKASAREIYDIAHEQFYISEKEIDEICNSLEDGNEN